MRVLLGVDSASPLGSSKLEPPTLLMEFDLLSACDGGTLLCGMYPGPIDLRGWRAAAVFCGYAELRVLCLRPRLAVVEAMPGGGMPESVLMDD
jgi:hypothetical protein